MDTHAIVRTSPKGTAFSGTCTRCGQENLSMSDAKKYCQNLRGVNNDQALIEIIDKEKLS